MSDLPSLSEPLGTSAPVSVTVLFGGQSSEHPISCLSAASILAALDRQRYAVTAVGITRDGTWHEVSNDPRDWQRHGDELPHVAAQGARVNLESLTTDVVFPVLHGPLGEDGTVQGALELIGIPYVGSGVFASALTMDKRATKRMLSAYGISVGPFVAFDQSDWMNRRDWVLASIADKLQFPVFVKPNRMGSSIGISKVTRGDALVDAITLAQQYDTQVVVEQSVEGSREIECGVLAGLGYSDPTASVCAEIVVGTEHEFYDFEAKYIDGSSELIVPAQLPDELGKEIRDLSVQAFQAIGCDGLARVDFFVAPDSTVYLNEINTMPGFTSVSMFPMMWQSSGLTYGQIVDHVIAVALDRGAGFR